MPFFHQTSWKQAPHTITYIHKSLCIPHSKNKFQKKNPTIKKKPSELTLSLTAELLVIGSLTAAAAAATQPTWGSGLPGSGDSAHKPKRQRLSYNREQTTLLTNLFENKQLETMDQRKDCAELVSRVPGGRPTTPAQVSQWVANQRKKLALTSGKQSESPPPT
jgi:hypothetical protein